VKIFNLTCQDGHLFEGWFSSGEDYESQHGRKLITCPLCGSSDITRLPAAAYLASGKSRQDERRAERPPAPPPQQVALQSQAMAQLVEYVVKHSEDVGTAFTEEARKIHYNETPARQIRGTASSKQVAELKEEGIDILTLPVAAPGDGKTH
jgi:hypothetical protein